MDIEVLKTYAHNRILMVNDKINGDFLHQFKEWLIALDLDEAPILVAIDSDGGEINKLFGTIDLIGIMKSPVVGLVNGRCFSAAVDLLQACRVRLATPSCKFHLHCIRGTIFYSAHLSDRKLRQLYNGKLKELRQEQKLVAQLYARRMGITEVKAQKLMDDGEENDIFFGTDEALQMKIIDGIVNDDVGIRKILSELNLKQTPANI
jgi:ATP-dependent protease ClpP protease subunit